MIRHWKITEVIFLRNNYGKMSGREVAEAIGRTHAQVMDKAKALGIPSRLRNTGRRRADYMARFGASHRTMVLRTRADLDQLDACASDCACRLLLGVGEQFAPAEAPQVAPVGVSRAIAERVGRRAA